MRRQRAALRPLGIAVAVAVVAASVSATPRPGVEGAGLGITLCLCAFGAMLLRATDSRHAEPGSTTQTAAVISVMGAAAVALVALQPHGATELAAGAAVFIAAARLPLALAAPIAAATTAGLDAALARTGNASAAVVAATLLCVLLAVVAHFMQQAREGQARSELLLAQLEDAREEQARAAAVEERGRIARDLHDVLAHSLSGAAIQLQGARMLAEREHATLQIREAIDRASGLVKEGLANARSAVDALRGDELPGVLQLSGLVGAFSTDTRMDVRLDVDGEPRALPPEAGLALYRGAQEALTNVARYAPGARTVVALRYLRGRTTLTVENGVSHEPVDGVAGLGGGRGLAGMRDRVERADGTMSAGPTDAGWRVELEVPA